MARPREYDEDDVLDRALQVFWTHGYEATSVSDLMAATGLAKGSVYKGFGDKKSLFLRTLDRYLEAGRARYRGLDDGKRPALSVLRDWMTWVAPPDPQTGCPRACYAINCIVELAPHDPDVRARLAEHQTRLLALYEATIRRGQADGTLLKKRAPDEAARWVQTTINGIQVAAKGGASPEDGAAMVEYALDALRA